MSFEYLPHTADLKAVVRAEELAALYSDTVSLVRDILVGTSPVRPAADRELTLQIDEEAERFFRFVRELLFLYDSEGFLTTRVELGNTILLSGERFDPRRHQSERQVKALTRHEFAFECRPEGYRAELLFDL